MDMELGRPYFGTITAKGRNYQGDLVFNLDEWTFHIWQGDLSFIHELKFLIPFQVEIKIVEPATKLTGKAKLVRIGGDMLFSGQNLEEVNSPAES